MQQGSIAHAPTCSRLLAPADSPQQHAVTHAMTHSLSLLRSHKRILLPARAAVRLYASGATASLMARAVLVGHSLSVPASFEGTALIEPAPTRASHTSHTCRTRTSLYTCHTRMTLHMSHTHDPRVLLSRVEITA